MLSIFPSLLVFTLAAPVILRLTVGVLFLMWGANCFGSGKYSIGSRLTILGKHTALTLGLTELAVGALLILGLYTQVAAIIGAILAFKFTYLSRYEVFGPANVTVYILVGIISLSLALTGPGFFAFDLPL
jgi:uncharacterized membrane protein YphA (DoxX/SURF4 family)